ncbi:MAG: hypothetical protein LBM26_00925 [Methanobrevibacter sp.]|nr:hypothetical protein [Methanobrevibacter sp.]
MDAYTLSPENVSRMREGIKNIETIWQVMVDNLESVNRDLNKVDEHVNNEKKRYLLSVKVHQIQAIWKTVDKNSKDIQNVFNILDYKFSG